jgi:hypothetical protein
MRRVTTWMAALTGAVLVLGACGPAKDGPAPGTLISASVDKTERSTAHISERITLQHGRDSVELQSAQGESDFDTHRSGLRMRLSMSRLDPRLSDRVVEVVSVEGVGYMRMEWLQLPPGKEWVQMSNEDVGISAAEDAGIGSRNPDDGLAYLNGVKNARETGHEDVGGTPTTRYAVTMDLDRMLQVVRKSARQISPAAERGVEALRDRVDVHHLPGAVWLDAAGRVRRFRYTFPDLAKGVDSVTEIEYSDFGEPVSIEVPPAEQTVPYASVVDQLRATAGSDAGA